MYPPTCGRSRARGINLATSPRTPRARLRRVHPAWGAARAERLRATDERIEVRDNAQRRARRERALGSAGSAPRVEHARHVHPPPAWGEQPPRAARGGGGRKSETARTRGTTPNAPPPRARAPPRTRHHTDARRRAGLTPPRGAQGKTDGRRENEDSHHKRCEPCSAAAAKAARPPDPHSARARAARASPVAMRAGHGLAPREAASEEKPQKPRDHDDADRQRVENTTTTTDRRVHLDVRKSCTHAEHHASTARRQSA